MRSGSVGHGNSRPFLVLGALLLVLGSGGVFWFLSPAGFGWRLRRMDLPALISFTALHPENGPALRELAQRMERQNLLAEALNNYLQSTQAEPNSETGWTGASRVALRLNDVSTALDAAQHAVRIAPASAAAQFTLGQAYARVGNADMALVAFRQAAQRAVTRADFWDALAEAAQEHENWQEAQQAALKATQLADRQASYWCRLAVVTRHLGDLNSAKVMLAKALQQEPRNPKILTEQGITLAQSARSPEERETARQALQAVVDGWPDTAQSYEARYELGQVLLAQQHLAEAEQRFRNCLQMRPDDQASAFALSRVLALEGKSGESKALLAHFAAETAYRLEVTQLQMRIRRQPQQTSLYTRLATLYSTHGDQEHARQVHDRLLQINSNPTIGK